MTVIDDYLTGVEPAKRNEPERIRTLAKQIVPDAEEAIVYGNAIQPDEPKASHECGVSGCFSRVCRSAR